MNKKDFLDELREALKENNMSRDIIENNVIYYDKYISEKLAQGETIEDVISELGSGRLIAKTIVEADKKGAKSTYYNTSSTRYTEDTSNNNDGQDNSKQSQSIFSFIMQNTTTKTKFKAVGITILIVAVIVLFVIFTFKVIAFVIPYILIMLVIGAIFRFISSR